LLNGIRWYQDFFFVTRMWFTDNFLYIFSFSNEFSSPLSSPRIEKWTFFLPKLEFQKLKELNWMRKEYRWIEKHLLCEFKIGHAFFSRFILWFLCLWFYFIFSFYHNLKLCYKKLGHKKTQLKKINMKTKKSVKWKTKTQDNHPNSFDILTSLGARISPQGLDNFLCKKWSLGFEIG